MAGLSLPLSQTFVNEALRKICDETTWSFQLIEGGWITPEEVTAGTVTAVLGQSTVTFDATAQAAIAAIPAPFLITTFQFRLPAYAIYSIVGYNPGTGIATLERPWEEPAGAGLSYMLYQCYYPAPVANFKRWISVRDFTNGANLFTQRRKQVDLNEADPQRTIFENPTDVVPYKQDTRTGSSTLGYMLYELYPQPLSTLPYALAAVSTGPQLVNPTDTLPFPLTEDLVKVKSRIVAYEWKEAQKGADQKRGSGADYRFLMQAAQTEYEDRLLPVKKIDRDLVDNFIVKIRRRPATIGAPFYSAITGQANVGGL